MSTKAPMTPLTLQSGILIHPVADDGSQDQHRACHHQPVDRRQEQAVPIELHQEHRHREMPHPVPLGSEEREEVFIEFGGASC